MTDEEFQADLAARRASVNECVDGMIADLHRPKTFYGRRRHETIVLALVTILARDTERAIFASCDGDDTKAVSIPKSQIGIVKREGDRFILATMKAWVAIDRHLAQANIPGLTKSVKWTDEERAAWKLIQAQIVRVRRSLADDNKPYLKRSRFSKKPIGTRNYFA